MPEADVEAFKAAISRYRRELLEEMRLLIHAIVGHQENEFCDDATIMVLERRPWRSTRLSGRRSREAAAAR